jgi:DNA-binding beta-propeller fold protein YncE
MAAAGALLIAGDASSQTPPPVPTREIEPLLEILGAPDDALSLPSDVALGERRIYVVDGGNHRVMVFDDGARYLLQFGGRGTEPGRFLDPVGIGTATDGKVYVADTGNARIQVFDPDGGFLSAFEVKVDKFAVRPIDVAVDPRSRELYVTGNNNHQVMVFSADGHPQRQWGGNGSNEGQFRYPATIAMVPDGRVAVVDVLNTRVQLFESSGTFSAELGEWGVLPGQLFRPKGVAVDKGGRYFVSDSYLNQVQVYSNDGVFEYVLAPGGRRSGLNTPVGMAIDAIGRLYVTEMLANRISVFQFRP